MNPSECTCSEVAGRPGQTCRRPNYGVRHWTPFYRFAASPHWLLLLLLSLFMWINGVWVSHGADTNRTPTVTKTRAEMVFKMDSLDDTNRLAIGDRVSLRILEEEEEPKSSVVMQSGGIEVPYLGRFPALGKTCKQLAYELKAELEKEYFFQATVLIAIDEFGRNRGKVYLVGAVRAAGPQEIPADEAFTLSKAIMRAGGFADYADKKRVKVTRTVPGSEKENTIFVVNLVDVIEKGRTDKDVSLMPGDLIFIPDRIISF